MSWSAMVSSNGILLNDCTQGRLTDFFERRPVAQIRRVRFWFALGVIFREALMA